MYPYESASAHAAPLTPVGNAASRVNWIRVVVWSVLIVLSGWVSGIAVGVSMARWQMYGATIDVAMANSRLLLRTVVWCLSAVLYWRFALGVASWQLLHVFLVLVLATIAGIGMDGLYNIGAGLPFLDGATQQLLDPLYQLRAVGAAVAGYAIARLRRRRKQAGR